MAETTTSSDPAAAEISAAAGPLVLRRRRRYSLLTRHDKLILALMVGIPLAFDLALIWGPTLASVVFSFTNWQGIGAITAENFVGLKNYATLLGSYIFFRPAFLHNLIWLGFLAFVATPIGMFFAVLLDREVRGTRIYQSIFYLPVVLPLVVVGFIWELQYGPTNGFINNAFGLVKSHHVIDWLGDPSINLLAAVVAASWRHGANERQTFFRVVFPVMAPINVIIVVITTIESLRAFDIAYIINRGKNGLELLST